MRDAARKAWNAKLGQISVTGGTNDERTVFYTALYHALLHPNVFSDANGQYMGFDNKLHSVKAGHAHYANFSGWDIYRCQVQLIAMLMPKVASDMAQSLVADAEQGGGLPRWSVANNEAGSMVGDPADVLVLALEGERRGAGDHLQPGDLAERVDNLLSQTIAELLVVGIPAHIGEGEHRD